MITSSASSVNPACNGASSGSITFGATSGGAGGYQYSINGGTNYFATNSFTGLNANTYQLRVRDANNCVLSLSNVTLTNPPVIAVNASGTHPLCNGNSTGTITVTASGGTGTLEYSRNNGSTYQSSNSFTGLPAGSYNIVVRDANLCTIAWGSNPLVLTNPAVLAISAVTPQNPTCFGQNNGQIAVTANGGTGAYNFSVNAGTSYFVNQPVTGLSAGSYTVWVRDANNCTVVWGSNPVVLTQPSALALTTSYVSCPGVNGNTTVRFTATGGNAPYQYRQGLNPLQSSNEFALANGSAGVQFQAQDNFNCPSNVVSVSTQASPTQIATSTTTATPCSCVGENRDLYLANGTDLVVIVNDQGENLDMLSATTYSHPTDVVVNGGAAMRKSFKVTSSGNAPSSNVLVKFPFTNAELATLQSDAAATPTLIDDVSSIGDVKVTRYKGTNEDNVYGGSLGDTSLIVPITNGSVFTGNTVTISTPGFSEYWLHGSLFNGPLPVVMLSFTAKAVGEVIQLDWKTATEINNKGFEVERSLDGESFAKIGFVNGNGTTTETKTYQFTDRDVLGGIPYYYRLKQIDFDGKSEYSPIKTAQTIARLIGFSFTTSPNPTFGPVNAKIYSEKMDVKITVTNTIGEVVSTQEVFLEKGFTTKILDLSFFPQGAYIISIETPTGKFTRRVIKY